LLKSILAIDDGRFLEDIQNSTFAIFKVRMPSTATTPTT
jgi:hypothetical protein